jgi:hypothetical protein
MDRFAVGTAVSLEIAYVDYNDNPVVPTAVSYTVLDENDMLLAGPIAIAGPYTTSASFTIDAAYNTPAGARQIELKMTNATGDTYADAMYQLKDSGSGLALLVNTFQTHIQALLAAQDLVNMSGWLAASEDQQIAALMEAYFRLTRFAYLIKWPEYVDTQNIYLQDMHARITPQMWPVMTPTLFAPYPVQFRNALKKAQIVEANSILVTDPIGDKRRAGIQMEQVGESRIAFRVGVRPLDFGVCRDTLLCIKSYLDFRVSLTRAP